MNSAPRRLEPLPESPYLQKSTPARPNGSSASSSSSSTCSTASTGSTASSTSTWSPTASGRKSPLFGAGGSSSNISPLAGLLPSPGRLLTRQHSLPIAYERRGSYNNVSSYGNNSTNSSNVNSPTSSSSVVTTGYQRISEILDHEDGSGHSNDNTQDDYYSGLLPQATSSSSSTSSLYHHGNNSTANGRIRRRPGGARDRQESTIYNSSNNTRGGGAGAGFCMLPPTGYGRSASAGERPSSSSSSAQQQQQQQQQQQHTAANMSPRLYSRSPPSSHTQASCLALLRSPPPQLSRSVSYGGETSIDQVVRSSSGCHQHQQQQHQQQQQVYNHHHYHHRQPAAGSNNDSPHLRRSCSSSSSSSSAAAMANPASSSTSTTAAAGGERGHERIITTTGTGARPFFPEDERFNSNNSSHSTSSPRQHHLHSNGGFTNNHPSQPIISPCYSDTGSVSSTSSSLGGGSNNIAMLHSNNSTSAGPSAITSPAALLFPSPRLATLPPHPSSASAAGAAAAAVADANSNISGASPRNPFGYFSGSSSSSSTPIEGNCQQPQLTPQSAPSASPPHHIMGGRSPMVHARELALAQLQLGGSGAAAAAAALFHSNSSAFSDDGVEIGGSSGIDGTTLGTSTTSNSSSSNNSSGNGNSSSSSSMSALYLRRSRANSSGSNSSSTSSSGGKGLLRSLNSSLSSSSSSSKDTITTAADETSTSSIASSNNSSMSGGALGFLKKKRASNSHGSSKASSSMTAALKGGIKDAAGRHNDRILERRLEEAKKVPKDPFPSSSSPATKPAVCGYEFGLWKAHNNSNSSSSNNQKRKGKGMLLTPGTDEHHQQPHEDDRYSTGSSLGSSHESLDLALVAHPLLAPPPAYVRRERSSSSSTSSGASEEILMMISQQSEKDGPTASGSTNNSNSGNNFRWCQAMMGGRRGEGGGGKDCESNNNVGLGEKARGGGSPQKVGEASAERQHQPFFHDDAMDDKDEKGQGDEEEVPVQRDIVEWKKGAQIGKGTFGSVFVGLNAKTGERFAIKQIGLVDGSRTEVAKLEKEITMMKDLHHRHIVRYIGTAHDPHNLYIFMEYVPGGSIASMLQQYGAFGEDLIRRLVAQIVLGIEYLHSRGIIHRDIKGANVLVTNNGVAKLADFGCSRRLHGLQTNSLENSLKTITGSVPWMAPEVIKQSGRTPKAADIWSIGATVIEMATASHPWPEFSNQMAALFHVATATAPPTLPESLSEVGKDFLRWCLEIDEAARATAAELLRHPFISKEVALQASSSSVSNSKDIARGESTNSSSRAAIKNNSNDELSTDVSSLSIHGSYSR